MLAAQELSGTVLQVARARCVLGARRVTDGPARRPAYPLDPLKDIRVVHTMLFSVPHRSARSVGRLVKMLTLLPLFHPFPRAFQSTEPVETGTPLEDEEFPAPDEVLDLPPTEETTESPPDTCK